MAAQSSRVFWNIDDCPIPDGLDPHQIDQKIKSGYENEYDGKISIKAYSDKSGVVNKLFHDYFSAGITLQNTVFGETQKLDQMLVDILFFAIDNPAPSHVVIISKEISEENELFLVLQDLKSANFIISVVLTADEIKSEALYDIVSSVMTWPGRGK